MRQLLLAATALAAAGCTQLPAKTRSWSEGVSYAPIGNATNMDAAFIMGAPNQSGLYTIRVHIKEGGLMPPHSHPDDRMITVVSGTLHYGFGDKADPAATIAYPTGSYFLAKANEPHYAIGKDEAVYQEAGMAPTGTKWVAQ